VGFGQSNPITRSDELDGFNKRKVLDLHSEPENVPAEAAAETPENLLFFADVKRGRFFVVEGTAGDVVSAAFLSATYSDTSETMLTALRTSSKTASG